MSDPRTSPDDALDLHLHAEEVSRAYRAGVSGEPPPELDDAIRAAARRGGGWWPRVAGRSASRAWGVPLAVAATLVVGVSVAFLAADRHDPHPERAPAAPAAEVARSNTDASMLREDPGAADRRTSAAEAPMSPTATLSEEARPSRERASREEMQHKRATARGDAAQAPARSVKPPPSADSTPAAVASSPVTVMQEAASPTPDAEAKTLSKAAPRAPAQGESEPLSPEVWLQRIRELKAKGDLAQMEENLRTFRRRYPDYPLPADIAPPAETGK